jgi:hypothetical protein
MKGLLDKTIQIVSTLLVSCMIIYGVAYAQPVCCSTIITTCIPSSQKMSVGYDNYSALRTSQSQDIKNRPLSNFCPDCFRTDFGSRNTCCETDHCKEYYPTTCLSVSFVNDHFPVQSNMKFFDATDNKQSTPESYSLSIIHKAVPIHILTQSIIC